MSLSLTSPAESTPAAPGVSPAAAAADESCLVPVLYERLAEALRDAENAITAGDLTARARHVERASSVVFELLAAVNFDRGGELAPRLAALYGFFAAELLTSARTFDRGQIRRLRDMVAVLCGSCPVDVAKERQETLQVLENSSV